MNGRIYDPILGRFLQVDPVISEPYNLQSYNAYSYVHNNPLSYTDPTGLSAWTEVRRPIAAIAVAALVMYTGAYMATGQWSIVALKAAGGVNLYATAAASGFASGGVGGGTLQSALRGAVTAMAFAGVGQAFASAHVAQQIAAHAVVGCVSSELSGGNCGRGALAAGFAKGVSAIPGMPSDLVGGTIVAAVSGGIGERLGGGKFANGAVTGAFGYLFNRFDSNVDDTSVSKLGSAPSFNRQHEYGILESAPLGDKNDPNAWLAASLTLHSWSAPGPMEFLPVGKSRALGLWGVFSKNPITQTSYGSYVVTNETKPGHILHGGELGSGTVVRWVGAAADNRLRIYTYGFGPNSSAFWAAANKPMGSLLFGGVVNPVNKIQHDTIYTNLQLGVKYKFK